MQNNLTKKEQNKFIHNNYTILSRKEMAYFLNKKPHQIKYMMRCLNLKSPLKNERSHSLNEDAFSSPLSLESCYWAGFIAADGCIIKNNMSVCLSRVDVKHLKKLRAFLQSTRKITQSKINTNTIFTVASKKIVQDLQKNFNIGPRKSLTLTPPKKLNRNQSLAYIIGYIDGDGTIGKHSIKYKNSKYEYVRLRIIGTPFVLSWINLIFRTNSKIIVHCNSKIYISSYSNQQLLKTLKIFTKQHKLPILKRKWNKIKGA